MATVTFTFGAKTKSFTVSAANVTRFSNWAAAAYPTIPNPAFPGTPGAPPTLPNPEPVLSAIDALWQGVKNNVISYEKGLSVAAVPIPGDLT